MLLLLIIYEGLAAVEFALDSFFESDEVTWRTMLLCWGYPLMAPATTEPGFAENLFTSYRVVVVDPRAALIDYY